MSYLWGIDLGGTKIEGVILDATDHNVVIARMRVATEASQGYQHVINQVLSLVSQLESASDTKATSIGMGTPGTTDPTTGLLKNSNTVCLNGMPFQKDLEKQSGITFKMANDANCFAVAEALMGHTLEQQPDAKVVFGVIMGTGVGGGLVINGQVNNGKQGIGGEWGHIFLDDSGGKCYCGRMGCVETIIAGPSIERWYALKSGQARPLKDIVARYRAGDDVVARDAMQRLFHFFGKGMAQVINIIDPDVIVLGGGLSNIPELYEQGVEEVRKHVFNHQLDTVFLQPKLGDSAGVFGAALL